MNKDKKLTRSENKGLIPELRFPEFVNEGEWFDITIESIGEVVTGGTPSKEDIGYWGGDFVWVTAQDFKEKYIHDSVLKLTEKGKDKSRVIPKNSVLVTCIASIGLNGINKVECATNQQINAIVCNSLNYYEFVYYAILKNITRLKNMAGQTAVPIISKSVFEKFTIQKPQKSTEQQKIAFCLSSLDEIITAHSQKLELLKEHKKGLMQNLFPQVGEKVPKLRFKEFEGDGEWSLKQLGIDKLIEIKGRIGYRGYTIDDIVNKGEGAISMSPSNIDENLMLNFEKSTYISWDKYEESPEIILNEGFTVLVKTGSSYGKAAYIKNLIEKTTINPQLVVLKPKKINSYFMYLLVTNSAVQKQIQETVVGGAIPTLSQDSISKFEVLVPKPKEQKKIADCLSSLNDLIIAQTQRVEQLKLHKKGLMQGLFPVMTGHALSQ